MATFTTSAAFTASFVRGVEPEPGGRGLETLGWDGVAADGAPVTPFQDIGLGRPLTVELRTIYLGEYPDAVPYFPIRKGDILVTSAVKPYSEFPAASRAVHFLRKTVTPRTFLERDASKEGSPIVFYTPAVTAEAIDVAFEITVDRDIDTSLFDAVGKAAASAAALPIFAPQAPFLLAGGAAVPIAGRAVNLLARPNPFIEVPLSLNFALPGETVSKKGKIVLRGNHPEPIGDEFTLHGTSNKLQDADGNDYAGPTPYLVVSLDGSDRSATLKSWQAHAASAALVDRFFSTSVGGDAIGIAQEALGLYNDLTFMKKATDAKAAAEALPPGGDK
ncbi:MAG: hypothetical protein WAL91_12800, partial [Propionicimonas sp.]